MPASKSPTMAWSSNCERRNESARTGDARNAAPLRIRLHRRLPRHRRRALSPQTSLPSADARRQTHARPTPSLGSQSLLLPEPHPHQRRRNSRAHRRSRLPPRLAQTHPRSRRRRHQTRRHRKMAPPRRSHRPLARASHQRRRHPPRHALRRAGLRRFRLHEIAPRSRRLFPHRTVFEKINHPAHRPPAPALPMALRRPRLFHRPPDPSPRRRRIRPRLRRQARPHPRPTRRRPRRPPRQVRHPLGPTRRPLSRLRKSRLAAPGRLPVPTDTKDSQ